MVNEPTAASYIYIHCHVCSRCYEVGHMQCVIGITDIEANAM